ncbi:cobalamin biosynthesis protein [Ornithinicoccus halotolerans]|nr:cobalamin biosynthesis protein [Ornithinicoccus halotolerans]
MSAVLVAAALDLTLGEPPAGLHPVAWMGRYLDRVPPEQRQED